MTKNKIHKFFEEIEFGVEGFESKKQCNLCGMKIDVSFVIASLQ